MSQDNDALREALREIVRKAKSCMTGGADHFSPLDVREIAENALASQSDTPAGPSESGAQSPSWACAARKQGTAGGNDPADCDWPACDCDPYAGKVIEVLKESGRLAPAPAEGRDAMPAEITPAIREVLGLMLWDTGPLAHYLNKKHGWSMPPKAEEEQAAVMFFLLPFAIKHGLEWRHEAGKVLWPEDEPLRTTTAPAEGGRS